MKEFLKAPGRVGAISPSSRRLARALVAAGDLAGAPLVVELGPGTGPITREIVENLSTEARFVAVEINPGFADRIRRDFSRAEVIQGSAADLPSMLMQRGLPKADRILCGLPWTAFPEPLQTAILDAVVASLAPKGRFVTFAYAPMNRLPGGARFHRMLQNRFASVEKSPLVRNLPPAFNYVCRL